MVTPVTIPHLTATRGTFAAPSGGRFRHEIDTRTGTIPTSTARSTRDRDRRRTLTSRTHPFPGAPGETLDAFLLSFAVIFVAELGDKSQLMALAFDTRYRAIHVLIGMAEDDRAEMDEERRQADPDRECPRLNRPDARCIASWYPTGTNG